MAAAERESQLLADQTHASQTVGETHMTYSNISQCRTVCCSPSLDSQ
jgi:hypothetical protein